MFPIGVPIENLTEVSQASLVAQAMADGIDGLQVSADDPSDLCVDIIHLLRSKYGFYVESEGNVI